LASILSDGIKGNPNGWYVSFLQLIILPNSVFIGYLVEWLELAIGIAFIVGAFLLLKRQKMQGEAGHKSLVGLYTAVVIAALLCVVLCINFHFWAGRGIIPGLHGDPGDEGVDLDALIPPLSLIVAFANYALILQLRGHAWFSKQRIA